MARRARHIMCAAEERKKLEALLRCRKQTAAMHVRVRIVLQCMDGMSIDDIAKGNGVAKTTVMRWKGRFLEGGVDALRDLPRKGRPVRYAEDFRATILKLLEQSPPPGHAQWDGVLLAEKTGYSRHAIWRFLKSQRICLARKRSWCISTDPEFAAKAADVVGLYLAPPENACVLCIDEKPNIQALERRTGYAVSSNRALVRAYESVYERRGTLNLFAALEVATGHVHAACTEPSKKTKKGFLEFMDNLLSSMPDTSEYHVIMDNHSIHKRHEAWLETHRNVFFHYVPTSASWLNMVEIWFGILQRKSLRGASFSNVEELGEHILAFQAAYNKNAEPFVWKKREVRGAQLSNSIHNFCN